MSTGNRDSGGFSRLSSNLVDVEYEEIPRGRSKVDIAQKQLRTDILNGNLRPGTKLAIAELANRYSCSAGVLREALPRLVGEGLVEAEPQIGFRVIPVSVEDLRQLTEARIGIETMVLRRSIAEGDVIWEARLLAAHHVLVGTSPRTEDGRVSQQWLAAHDDFHSALLEGCANIRLRNMAKALRAGAEVYRCWSKEEESRQGRDVSAEHRRVLEATLARDLDAACAALEEHIQRTSDLLLKSQSPGIDTV